MEIFLVSKNHDQPIGVCNDSIFMFQGYVHGAQMEKFRTLKELCNYMYMF